MEPFRVFDKKHKVTWLVLNFEPSADGGRYLVSREDESTKAGDMTYLTGEELSKLRFLNFMDGDDLA